MSNSSLSLVERIATWAHELTFDDVPTEVLALSRAQRRSVLGAMAASIEDAAARRVVAGVDGWAGDGPAPLVGRGRRVPVEDAVYAATALSVALDFDDYVMFGHTGHSSVLVPILMAAETGTDGRDQLVAQVVANEVEARLGGATLLGPLNGQLWAFVHAAGAALAAGRLLDLDPTALAHALAISLAHPVRATVPGFMAPDSKLLVAAEPAVAGVRAARLAAAGVTGPLDALDDPRGALAALSYAPVREILGGLGQGWATQTLSVKAYPGCAYLDTTVDALREIDAGPISPDEVGEVRVEAGMLTCGMDALSRPYASASPPTPVTVTFSVVWNVAIAVLAGQLTEREVSAPWLAEHADELDRLRRRVTLRHDPELTARSADAFASIIPAEAVLREVGPLELASAVRRVRSEHPGTGVGLRDLPALARSAGGVRRLARLGRRTSWWDPDTLADFVLAFPARVTLRLRAGTERSAEVSLPRGGAGNREASPREVASEKLNRSGPRLFGSEGTAALDHAIEVDDAKLHDLLDGSEVDDA